MVLFVMHVLIVEDHADLAANIGDYLERCGETVDFAPDGLTALHLLSTQQFGAVVLDLGLPGAGGLDVCRQLRASSGYTVPVLMLTARDTERDKLDGFAAGADDYLTKPFSLPELHARLVAAARRYSRPESVLGVDTLVYERDTHVARRGNRRLVLTPIGIRLLRLLITASPRVVTRAEIEREIWGDHAPNSDAALRGHIQALRAAIDGEGEPRLLHTQHGMGYRLARDDEAV